MTVDRLTTHLGQPTQPSLSAGAADAVRLASSPTLPSRTLSSKAQAQSSRQAMARSAWPFMAAEAVVNA